MNKVIGRAIRGPKYRSFILGVMNNESNPPPKSVGHNTGHSFIGIVVHDKEENFQARQRYLKPATLNQSPFSTRLALRPNIIPTYLYPNKIELIEHFQSYS